MESIGKAKIIFFGTSDRSLPILETLRSNFELVLCITKSNSKIGGDQIEKETGVKTWAKENNIDFIEIDSLKNENLDKVLKCIKKSKPDLGIVADFSFIIPKKVIEAFDNKIINIHFSLLPKYRGASPVQYAILNGDYNTGVTFYYLDEKMDTGNIIDQIEYKVTSKETSGELYDILFKIASNKLPEIINNIYKGDVTSIPQDESNATYTYSKTNPKHTFIFKEDAQVEWNKNPDEIERSIRAYDPWPIAWSYLKDLEKSTCFEKDIILKKSVNKDLKIKLYKGKISNNKLEIEEVKVEGKKRITWKEFENGYLISTTSTD